MKDAEKNINYIKDFIQTFYFAKNIELIVDESALKQINKTHKENNSSVNIYSCYSIWLCMNEIYPSWFDISIHPAQFDSEMDAYECILKYLNEYHEGKFEIIIKKILGNLLGLTINDFIDIYSLVILAALVSDDKQKHINSILSLSHETQKYIHTIVEVLDKTESAPKEAKLSTQNSSNKDITNINESMKNEIKQLKEKVKYLEIENENLTNSITEKNKIVEETKEKINNLQKQINTVNEKAKIQYIAQIEEHEKKIHELQSNLEKQTKDKNNIENNLKNKIKELEDEQNILKQENSNIDNLQNKINKYKEKIDSLITVQNINKELEDRLKGNTKKAIDMENEVQKLRTELNSTKMYKDKCSELSVELEKTKNEYEKLQQANEEKNKTMQQLKNDLEEKTKAYDLIRKEQNLKKFNIGLSNVDQTEELLRLKKENENLKNEIDLKKNEELNKVKEFEKEIANLKKTNEELKNKTEEIMKNNTESDKKLPENDNLYLKEIEEEKKSIENKEKELKEKQKELENKQRDIDNKQKELESKQRDIDNKQKELESKQRDIDNKQKELESKQRDIDNKQKELDEKQKETEHIKKELEGKNKEVEAKQKDIENREKESNEAKVETSNEIDQMKKNIEQKQKEINELKEANEKMVAQLSSMKGNVDTIINDKVIKLEAELLMEKKNAGFIEETTKNKLSKEFNSALQIFKEQLQIREKEIEYYKDALKMQIDMTKDEQKLLSGIIHGLGLKYKQLQTYNLSLKNEIIGIKQRTQAYVEPERK
ncbi:conserved Plasmodium protein, unknown function [Plasmodium vinckei vinckei]|uniref:Uncharacterized protein n=1 Tax=Plasmodium vinckei vinckei TaxID=54757 RepID=A0A449BNQ9_PLAVN|nr:conserved Plasmodium protein, unknown function [Plasmodium vinckei vinckei]VEV55091.1 conserved Plasmodium protein, unknown function [Plasmodium vinckei vinckei]